MWLECRKCGLVMSRVEGVEKLGASAFTNVSECGTGMSLGGLGTSTVAGCGREYNGDPSHHSFSLMEVAEGGFMAISRFGSGMLTNPIEPASISPSMLGWCLYS